jgi:hypothetical protein
VAEPTELWDEYPLEAEPTYDFNVTVATATPGPTPAPQGDAVPAYAWLPLVIVILIAIAAAVVWHDERRPIRLHHTPEPPEEAAVPEETPEIAVVTIDGKGPPPTERELAAARRLLVGAIDRDNRSRAATGSNAAARTAQLEARIEAMRDSVDAALMLLV